MDPALSEDDKIANVIHQSILKLEDYIYENLSREHKTAGCTACMAFLNTETDILYLANIGDSRAFIFQGDSPIFINREHKPASDQEKTRVQTDGGYIISGRVNGCLAVTRALGDFNFKAKRSFNGKPNNRNEMNMVSPTPDITSINLKELMEDKVEGEVPCIEDEAKLIYAASDTINDTSIDDLGSDLDNQPKSLRVVPMESLKRPNSTFFAANDRVSVSPSSRSSTGSNISQGRKKNPSFTSNKKVPADPIYMIIACDGVWDVIQPIYLLKHINHFFSPSMIQKHIQHKRTLHDAIKLCSQTIVHQAYRNFSQDNITALVVKLT